MLFCHFGCCCWMVDGSMEIIHMISLPLLVLILFLLLGFRYCCIFTLIFLSFTMKLHIVTDFNQIHSRNRHVCCFTFITLCHMPVEKSICAFACLFACVYGSFVCMLTIFFGAFNQIWLFMKHFCTHFVAQFFVASYFFSFGMVFVWFGHMQIIMQIGKKHKIFCVWRMCCCLVDSIAVCFYSVHA